MNDLVSIHLNLRFMKTVIVHHTNRLFKIFLIIIVYLHPLVSQSQISTSQESYTEFRGKVVDKQSKEPLLLATITIEGTNASSVSNNDGEYLIKVPKSQLDGILRIQYTGYQTTLIPIASLNSKSAIIYLESSELLLKEVDVIAPKNATQLVLEVFANKGKNYSNTSKFMTAFYREQIKRRSKNIALAEAVSTIVKRPYNNDVNDAISIVKARKSTDYNSKDTLAIKFQGGPYNALYIDVIKYSDFIFSEELISQYDFSFKSSTRINNKLIYIVHFEPKQGLIEQRYTGNLYIDIEDKVLTNAIFSLKITDPTLASKLFVQKKPKDAFVYPTEVTYRVDYRVKNNQWYYGYSNINMTLKVEWNKRLFNSVYSMQAEMAITDWDELTDRQRIKFRDRVKSSIILADEADGFSDPEFWGAYNIIEPDKSIENAIRKIRRQLKRINKE